MDTLCLFGGLRCCLLAECRVNACAVHEATPLECSEQRNRSTKYVLKVTSDRVIRNITAAPYFHVATVCVATAEMAIGVGFNAPSKALLAGFK